MVHVSINTMPYPMVAPAHNTQRPEAHRCTCAHPLLVPSYVLALLGFVTLLGGFMCMVGPVSSECPNNVRIGLSVTGAILAVVSFAYCIIIQCVYGTKLRRWRAEVHDAEAWTSGLGATEPVKPPAYSPRDTAPPPYSPPRTPPPRTQNMRADRNLQMSSHSCMQVWSSDTALPSESLRNQALDLASCRQGSLPRRATVPLSIDETDTRDTLVPLDPASLERNLSPPPPYTR